MSAMVVRVLVDGAWWVADVGAATGADRVSARREDGSGIALRGRLSGSWEVPQAAPRGLATAIREAVEMAQREAAAAAERERAAGRVVELKTSTGGATWHVAFGASVTRHADEGGDHPHRHLALAELRDVVSRERAAGRALRVIGASEQEVQP